MVGLFLSELYKYVTMEFEKDTWADVLRETGTGPRVYVASSEYPDEEMVSLVSAASEKAGISVPEFLEHFGEFMAQDLVRIYGGMIDPEWKTLDLLQNISGFIHRRIQSANPEAKPLDFTCNRTGPDELVMIYSSPGKLCAIAIGLAKGFAKHYNEHITVTERSCTFRGTPSCEILVELVKDAAREKHKAASLE